MIFYCDEYIHASNNKLSSVEFNEVPNELYKVKILQEYKNSQYNTIAKRLSRLALFYCQRDNHMYIKMRFSKTNRKDSFIIEKFKSFFFNFYQVNHKISYKYNYTYQVHVLPYHQQKQKCVNITVSSLILNK